MVELGAARIAVVHGQPEMSVAIGLPAPGDLAQQPFADARAAPGSGYIKILHVDAGLAHPGREEGEVQAHAGEAAVVLGQHHFEFLLLTETVALQARARAAQALGHAQRRRQFLERAQDHVAIGFGGDAKAQVWRGRCGHGVLDGVAAKDRP